MGKQEMSANRDSERLWTRHLQLWRRSLRRTLVHYIIKW